MAQAESLNLGSARSSSLEDDSGSIQGRQNAAQNIDLLAAQRQLYSEGKLWRRVRVWSVAAVALVGVAVTGFAPEFVRPMGVVGALSAIAQWAASIAERQRTKTAAKIQEQFDTNVLSLEWNPVLGSKIDPEDSVAAAARYKGPRDKLRDWYSVPDGVPRPLDVVLCQRENLRWDAALRAAYACSIVLVLVGLLVVDVGLGLLRGLTLSDFAVSMLPSVGALLLGVETVRQHRQHAAEQFELKRIVESTWGKGVQDLGAVTPRELRAIQDGIYRLRVAAPPVPDGFYWWRRDQQELEMRAAAERMCQELEAALTVNRPSAPSRH